MDEEGNVTIKGRSKNMLLGPSGQNIYPEEIEEKISNLPYVCENIVIQQSDHKLTALIYPDFEEAYKQGLTDADIERIMEENRVAVNAEFLLILRLRASRFTRKNLKRHLRKASSVSYTKKSSSIMKRTFIFAFLLGGILAGTHLSAQETKPASALKKGPNVSLNITNKKEIPAKDIRKPWLI